MQFREVVSKKCLYNLKLPLTPLGPCSHICKRTTWSLIPHTFLPYFRVFVCLFITAPSERKTLLVQMLCICIFQQSTGAFRIGFDRYGHTDTDTDIVIPIYSKPIPILPSRIYIKPIPIQFSKFISNRYRYRYSFYVLYQTDTDTDNWYRFM